MKKHEMIKEIIMLDNNETQLSLWASAFLGGLSKKQVKEIYDREINGID